MTQMCNSEVKSANTKSVHYTFSTVSVKSFNYFYIYVLSPPLHFDIIPKPYLFFYAEYLQEARKMSEYIAVFPCLYTTIPNYSEGVVINVLTCT